MITFALFTVGTVELDLVADARQQIRIQRVDGIVDVAFGRGGEGVVDAANRPLAVVRGPASAVVHRRSLVVDVGAARGGAPLPAVLTHLTRAAEVVQIHELLGDRVKVRGDGLRELRDAGIPVAARNVAQDLVVGAVLLDDVDDVPDVLVELGHDGLLVVRGRVQETVVVRHGLRQLLEFVPVRRRQRQQSGLGELPDVLIRRAILQVIAGQLRRVGVAGRGHGALAGFGPKAVALSVHHVQRLAVAADADRVREPGRRDEASRTWP